MVELRIRRRRNSMLTVLYFGRADFGLPRDLLRRVPWDKTGGKREEDRARVFSVTGPEANGHKLKHSRLCLNIKRHVL